MLNNLRNAVLHDLPLSLNYRYNTFRGMVVQKRFLLVLILLLCFCPYLFSKGLAESSAPAQAGQTEAVPALPPEYFVTLIATGDNLCHDVMIREGEQGDYDSFYSPIQHIIKSADIAFINQETVLAGKEFGFSGYPQFNTPQKVGQAIAAVGFNVVNQSTNHIMDKGERAVFATMDFWDTVPGVTVLGIHRSREQRSMPKLVVKNNITVGFLSYTFSTNGLPIPSDKPWLVSFVNTETMAKEIDALRPLCEFLVVSMHWGEEYQHDYNKSQERLAAFLAEHRVDLVIGHHPHVIQPVEYVTRPDGGTMLCFYSLGNFISGQTQNPTMLGALAYVRIKKTPAQNSETAAEVILVEAGAIPVVTHYEADFTGFKVYPLYAYTDELAGKHRQNREKKSLTTAYLTALASKVLGNMEITQNPFQ